MGEYAFELRLCAHLESAGDAIVSRQLGGAVRAPDRRVLDVVVVETGPRFDERARLTDAAIPRRLLESPIGPGSFRDWRRILGEGMAAERAIQRGIEIGVLEVEYRRGRELVRAVGRYPEDWFDRIVSIENKPHLDEPGALYDQLQFDVSLGLVDAVVLVTQSHVTRAHRNRLPDEVGVWRFDPAGGTLDVLVGATPLEPTRRGIEIAERQVGRTDIELIEPSSKRAARRHLAERAYGKGWRTFQLPPCANVDPEGGPAPGMPMCAYHGRLVDPVSACGPSCRGFRASAPPTVDLASVRAANSPWVHDPPDRRRRQARLDGFSTDQVS
ncbi:MAG: DUF5787 family protein [Halobacteriota archaeon]